VINVSAFDAEFGRDLSDLLRRLNLSYAAASRKVEGKISHTTWRFWCFGQLPSDPAKFRDIMTHFTDAGEDADAWVQKLWRARMGRLEGERLNWEGSRETVG
jgi:hypothetical protein